MNAKPSRTLRASLEKLASNPWVAVALFIGAGGVGLAFYHDMPIVRNSLLYARIAYALSELGTDFSVKEHAFNKALGFPFISCPLVMAFGANVGLKVSTFIWTSLWAVSMVFFFRRLERVFPWDSESRPAMSLLLVAVLFNPLVYYQFLSAYPDSLNALNFLWSLVLLDRMFSKESRWFDGVLFSALLLFSVWVKHHGFIVLAILAIFAVCRIKLVGWMWKNSRVSLIIAATLLVLAFVVIGLAQAGHIPVFNLSKNPDNYSRGFDHLLMVFGRNVVNLKDYLWLSFTFFIPLLFRWKHFRRYKEWYISLAVFVVTVLVYRGAQYNIRYFLPVAPLFAWIICNNLSRVGKEVRRVLIAVFLAINLFHVLYYNSIWFNKRVETVQKFESHDNLRLVDEQFNRQRDIDAVNEQANEKRNTLFFARSYYREGMWYVWEREGLFTDKIKIVYMRKTDWKRIKKYADSNGLEEALLYTRDRIEKGRRYMGIRNRKLTRRTYLLTF